MVDVRIVYALDSIRGISQIQYPSQYAAVMGAMNPKQEHPSWTCKYCGCKRPVEAWGCDGCGAQRV